MKKIMVLLITLAITFTMVNTVFCVDKPEVVSNIDTSAIDNWCGGYSDGAIRMVGGWVNGEYIEDETGRLWDTGVEVSENDFLLLWIADNHTPDCYEDDIVIKVWREAY